MLRADDIDAVALTGGVFQNVRLTEIVEDELMRAGSVCSSTSESRRTTAASALAKPPSPPAD
jgi:hydrogenase maturation factor HypF (carbamoyltransferase family)